MAKKIIGIVFGTLVVLIVAMLWYGLVMTYNENFDVRWTTDPDMQLYVSNFDGLSRSRYQFESNKGQTLTGYLYSAGDKNKKGIVVFAHGFGGGGHSNYMDHLNFFAQNGYYVFAYDATGNDESQGLGKNDGVGGLPQGVIDLNYAISFVEKSGNFPELPIVLFGHSWGGYSVSSVTKYHPEVKAVAECAGFYSSALMFQAEGKKLAGNAVYILMPFLRIHEFLKYGKYAWANGAKGFSSTDALVLIAHSKNDDTVPPEYGYDMYYKKFKDDPRFTFILYEDKGHSNLLDSEELFKTILAMYDKAVK